MAEILCLSCMKKYDDQLATCPYCGSPQNLEPEKPYFLKPGTVLAGKYAIGKAVGSGGFGITYKAYDLALEKVIAIKEYFPAELATRETGTTAIMTYGGQKTEMYNSGISRFIDEARRLVKFKDTPGIVSIADAFEINNTAYIAMEFLEGKTVKQLMKERGGKLPVKEAVDMLLPMLKALSQVHKEGIVHRDVAPDNIFITTDGQVKLIDFGAARYANPDEKSLSIILKHGFAPPEQYRSKGNQGSWTDVYACAATLYQMITGKIPEPSLERENKDELLPPSKLGVKIDPNTENAIMNALNLPIDKRTQTADQFAEELEGEKLVDRVVVKQEKKDIGKLSTKAKVGIGIGIVAVIALLVLVLGGFFGKWFRKESGIGDQVRVPNTINTEVEKARVKLSDSSLKVQIFDRAYSDEIPVDLVLSQSKEAGSVVDKDTIIDLTISAGEKKGLMPSLIGLASDRAVQKLQDATPGNQANYEITEEESALLPDMVFSQSVEMGKSFSKSEKISLTVSTGLSDVDPDKDTSVPDFTGKNIVLCLEEAKKAKVYIFIIDSVYDDTVPAGRIISQDTEKGSTVPEGSKVGLVLSLGKKTVLIPDVSYKDKDTAVKTLTEAGLNVEIDYVENGLVADGHVVAQDIAGGSTAEEGSTVKIFVSKQKEGAGTEYSFASFSAKESVPSAKKDNTPTVAPTVTEAPAATDTPTPTLTPTPEISEEPTETETPAASETPTPTELAATDTPVPVVTKTGATDTPTPKVTKKATNTPTPTINIDDLILTMYPNATSTPTPTQKTAAPTPTNTPKPTTPTPTPCNEITYVVNNGVMTIKPKTGNKAVLSDNYPGGSATAGRGWPWAAEGFNVSSVKIEGTIVLGSDASYMFAGLPSVGTFDLTGLDTSKVKNMSYMFANCSKTLDITITGLDTSKATDLRYMFKDCYKLMRLNITGFKTNTSAKVDGMFDGDYMMQSVNCNDARINAEFENNY